MKKLAVRLVGRKDVEHVREWNKSARCLHGVRPWTWRFRSLEIDAR